MRDYYWFWLCNIPGIGNKKLRLMLEVFDDAKDIYDAGKANLKLVQGLTDRNIDNIITSKYDDSIYHRYMDMKKKDIKFIHIKSEEYPEKLKNIYDYPICLYYKGELPQSDLPAVSIIGARTCSTYGREVAEGLGRELVDRNIQVISGMARGIDSAGHLGAINGNGKTFAVLGSGVDVCYPRENINLYMDILQNGGIISEYPPETNPIAGNFPMRNRIISGLSDIIVVVEAKEKSGSLITVDMALEQNKEIMVIPGRINDKLSQGCNNLIKLGAQVVTCVEDIVENLENTCGFAPINVVNKRNCENIVLASPEKMVYASLDLLPKSLDIIIEETGLELLQVSRSLLLLELEGLAKEISKNYYIKVYNPK